MKLSLSVRVAESFFNKKESSMTLDELLDLALAHGYQALCLRASQAGIHTPADQAREMSDRIRQAGLVLSMVTGDFKVPTNDAQGPDGLRKITPYLDLAETFGTDLIRICMKTTEDIVWAQLASDEAAERGIRLAHQSHTDSLFETVESSLQVLGQVARSNFGIIYEPANWMIAGEDYGPRTIEKLEESIFNVYVQNHRLNPDAADKVQTWGQGPVGVDHIGLWQQGGVDYSAVFEGLHGIGYTGFVTVHQSFQGVMTVADAVGRSSRYLAGKLGTG